MSYFYCYSPKLRRFIMENGIKWINKGINQKSGFPFWKYEDNDELGKILKKYET